jgi:putative salt-induced outer membrane protein
MTLRRLAAPLLVTALVLLTTPGTAGAQTADTTKQSPLKGSIDVGLVAASGNTDLTTFNLGQKLEYLKGKWEITQGARRVNGQTNGVESANEYAAAVQPAYLLSARWKAYGLASWDRNPFLGVTTRWQEGLGLSFAAVHGACHTLDVDGGFSFF